MPPTPTSEYAATVEFQGQVSHTAIGLIFVSGVACVFGVSVGLGVPTSHFGLVFLGAIAFSSVLLMVSLKMLRARARRCAVVSFRPPVLHIPDHDPVNLESAHDLRIFEFQERIFLRMREPIYVCIGLGGGLRRDAEAAFEAPWFIESVAVAPDAQLTLDSKHRGFSLKLIEESGRSRAVNKAFSTWCSYPWNEPFNPAPLSPGVTPETLPEEATWADPAIGVSASYIFFREDKAWRILSLGAGLRASLEVGRPPLSFEGGSQVQYVYVVLRSAQTHARICMEESGSIHPGAINADIRRALVAFINSRSTR